MGAVYIAEYNKLKHIQRYLEKSDNLEVLLSNLELSDFSSEIAEKRQAEELELQSSLKQIWLSIKETRKQLSENIECLNIKDFKKGTIALQDKILDLKIQIKSELEILKDEEKNLTEINDTFNQKLESWEKRIKFNIHHQSFKVKQFYGKEESDNKEVKEFIDFVARSNGHENGWAVEDHQLFLKLRKKHKDPTTVAIQLHKLLADIPITEIVKHEKWYTQYIQLKHTKNESIKKWRQAKIVESCEPSVNEKHEKKTKKQVLPDNSGTKEKLAIWKAEKKAKLEARLEADKEKQNEMKYRNEIMKENRKLLKTLVDEWRDKKTLENLLNQQRKLEVEEKEKQMRAAAANRRIKQFQSKDDMYIRMKSAKLKTPSIVKRSKSGHIAPRDPERLLKPTKTWLQRLSAEDNFSSLIFIPNIKQIPKLGIPEWRRKSN